MVIKVSAYGVVHQKLKLQLQMIILNYGNLQIHLNLLKIILKTLEWSFELVWYINILGFNTTNKQNTKWCNQRSSVHA